eukprot:2162380-Rhodomonas_salina.2
MRCPVLTWACRCQVRGCLPALLCCARADATGKIPVCRSDTAIYGDGYAIYGGDTAIYRGRAAGYGHYPAIDGDDAAISRGASAIYGGVADVFGGGLQAINALALLAGELRVRCSQSSHADADTDTNPTPPQTPRERKCKQTLTTNNTSCWMALAGLMAIGLGVGGLAQKHAGLTRAIGWLAAFSLGVTALGLSLQRPLAHLSSELRDTIQGLEGQRAGELFSSLRLVSEVFGENQGFCSGSFGGAHHGLKVQGVPVGAMVLSYCGAEGEATETLGEVGVWLRSVAAEVNKLADTEAIPLALSTYAMSGADIEYAPTSVRYWHRIPSVLLRARYAMSGSVLLSSYGAAMRYPVMSYFRTTDPLCDVRYWHVIPTVVLCTCYAMSGTDVGYAPTRSSHFSSGWGRSCY